MFDLFNLSKSLFWRSTDRFINSNIILTHSFYQHLVTVTFMIHLFFLHCLSQINWIFLKFIFITLIQHFIATSTFFLAYFSPLLEEGLFINFHQRLSWAFIWHVTLACSLGSSVHRLLCLSYNTCSWGPFLCF